MMDQPLTVKFLGLIIPILSILIGIKDTNAMVLTPVVNTSIQDGGRSGIISYGNANGQGDFFSSPGFLRNTTSIENRAIIEFDISSFQNASILNAMLDFDLRVNNSGGSQFRQFDVYVYAGNGGVELSDFSATNLALSPRISLSVSQIQQSYNFNTTNILEDFTDKKINFIGFVVDPIGTNNFPTILENSKLTVTAIAVVPEPLTILGVVTAIGFGTFFKQKLSN